MAIKNVLVTGSSGTIGTALCGALLKSGYRCFGADLKKNEWSKTVDRLTTIMDLTDKNQVLKRLPRKIDCIIHLAANARVYDLVVNPSLARDNFEMTFNVMEFARLNGVKKFIFASSREVYGNSGKVKYLESDSRLQNCESPYNASKMGGEALIWSYQRCYGIDFIIFRFSNVYGKYDNSERLVPVSIRNAAENKDLTVFGGDKVLDFTYIDDVIDGILLSLKKFDRAKNNAINLAFGKGQSIKKVVKLVRDGMRSDSRIIIKDSRTGEVIKYTADISKAGKLLGYNPKVPIEKGITRTIEWHRNNHLI